MDVLGGVFQVERDGDTLVLTPVGDLGELAYKQIEAATDDLLDRVSDPAIRGVLVDFGRTDYFGTTALGFFVQLWKRLRDREGRMAFCNVSEHEKEILRVTKLGDLWPMCGSREEALASLRA
jgi:anti-anti-sigma factor